MPSRILLLLLNLGGVYKCNPEVSAHIGALLSGSFNTVKRGDIFSASWYNSCAIDHMAKFRQNLGQRGEELAEAYLRQRGYKILHRNYRFGKGELDLICRLEDNLVIVEVKSIRSPDWGSGEERISRRKQSMIIRTTYAFLAQNKQYNGLGVRFDVVVINFSCFPVQITHHCGAFWQGMS